MSYASQNVLRADPELLGRVAMACAQEARSKPDTDYVGLALTSPDSAAGLMMPSLLTEPGWDQYASSGDVTDAVILSGLQAVWDGVATRYSASLGPVA